MGRVRLFVGLMLAHCVDSTALVPVAQMLTVHVIAHSHCDPGWLNTFEVRTQSGQAHMREKGTLTVVTAVSTCALSVLPPPIVSESLTPRCCWSRPALVAQLHVSSQGYYTAEVRTVLDSVMRELVGHEHRKFVWSEM